MNIPLKWVTKHRYDDQSLIKIVSQQEEKYDGPKVFLFWNPKQEHYEDKAGNVYEIEDN